jgi:ankyrin repeat protein
MESNKHNAGTTPAECTAPDLKLPIGSERCEEHGGKELHRSALVLIRAACKDDLAAARTALADGADPNSQPENGSQWLDSDGEDEFEAELSERWAPIHAAASRGSADVLELILERGANPNLEDDSTTCPLHLCSTPQVVVALVEFGAEIDRRDVEGRSALHYARTPAVTIHLLANGADPKAIDTYGVSAAEYKSSASNLTRFMGSNLGTLNEIGSAKLIHDWLQAHELLPRMQALSWRCGRHTRLAIDKLSGSYSPVARLPAEIVRMVGETLMGRASIDTDALGLPVLSRFVWERFNVWLNRQAAIQRRRDVAAACEDISRLWPDLDDSTRVEAASRLAHCGGLQQLLASTPTAASTVFKRPSSSAVHDLVQQPRPDVMALQDKLRAVAGKGSGVADKESTSVPVPTLQSVVSDWQDDEFEPDAYVNRLNDGDDWARTSNSGSGSRNSDSEETTSEAYEPSPEVIEWARALGVSTAHTLLRELAALGVTHPSGELCEFYTTQSLPMILRPEIRLMIQPTHHHSVCADFAHLDSIDVAALLAMIPAEAEKFRFANCDEVRQLLAAEVVASSPEPELASPPQLTQTSALKKGFFGAPQRTSQKKIG